MNRKFLSKPSVWISVGVLALLVVLQFVTARLTTFDLVERLEWITYDWRVKEALKTQQPTAPNLGFAVLDDTTLKEMNERHGYTHPLPRQLYGQLIKELNLQGAKAVGFDIFFTERHPTNPVTAFKVPNGGSIDSDEYLALQLRQWTNTVLCAGDDLMPAQLFRTNATQIGDISSMKDSDGIQRRIMPFNYFTNWHWVLEDFARANDLELTRTRVEGNRILFYQADGKPVMVDGKPYNMDLNAKGEFQLKEFWEGDVPIGAELQKAFTTNRVWHMGLVLAAMDLKLDLNKAIVKPGMLTLAGEGGVTRHIPLNRDGSMFINWSIRENHPGLYREPMERVIEAGAARAAGKSDIPNTWKGKIVIVGSTGTGNNIADIGATPMGRSTFLVSKYWNVANSIIINRLVHRSSYFGELLLICFLSIGASVATWRFKAPWQTVLVLVVGMVYVGVALLLYVKFQYWLPIVLPVIGGLLFTHAAQISYQVIFEQQEKRRVKGVFAKVVSPNVVNELLALDDLKLGGSRKNITVFFADVRGFTQLTDAAQRRAEEYIIEAGLKGAEAETYRDEVARETLATVNTYLATIADQIKKHDGTLDKYIGDCVMAFWGAPTPNDRHAESCVLSAIAAQRAMYQLNQTRLEENKRRAEENMLRQASGLTPLEMLALLSLGTGINSGIVTVGMMGSKDAILNYTVFGGPVNLASRLEGLSGRGRIIIGEATYKDLLQTSPELAATIVELPPAMVKGIPDPVRNWEVPWKEKEKTVVAGIKPIDADSTSYIPKDQTIKRSESDATNFIPKIKPDEPKKD